MRTRSTLTDKNGIHWYYEREGSGPHVVLIPDGWGECQMMDKPMSLIAAEGFTCTTFDMPGFSRSSDAPPETYQEVTAQKLASYVISILDELRIDYATFWGCSSGGATVLALVADYPERVRNALPHEVPTAANPKPALDAMADMDDEAILEMMEGARLQFFGSDMTTWDALGEEAHVRIRKGFPRWACGYPRTLPSSAPTGKEDLLKRPMDWTVGADSATSSFIDNIITATKFDIPIGTLPGKHFPYTTHPEAMAKHVVETTRKYL